MVCLAPFLTLAALVLLNYLILAFGTASGITLGSAARLSCFRLRGRVPLSA